MYKNSLLTKFTNILVNLFFYLGFIVTLAVPLWAPMFYKFVELEAVYHNYMTFMLLFSGACAVFIIYNLMCIFKTFKKDPFVPENIKYLFNMAIMCLIIFAIYTIKIIFIPTLATVIIIAVFFMAGLFCLTIKDLFAKAVEYKQDTDMTI